MAVQHLSPTDIIALALAAPLPQLSGNWVISATSKVALDPMTKLTARAPVLAWGDWCHLDHLHYLAGHDDLPVMQAQLGDFDVVWIAAAGSHGGMLTGLAPSKGTTIPVMLLWLNAQQLEDFNRTLGPEVYQLIRLNSLKLDLAMGKRMPAALAFVPVAGYLLYERAPVAVSDSPAGNRALAEAQADWAIEEMQGLVAPDLERDDLILQLAHDPAWRHAKNGELRQHALPCPWK